MKYNFSIIITQQDCQISNLNRQIKTGFIWHIFTFIISYVSLLCLFYFITFNKKILYSWFWRFICRKISLPFHSQSHTLIWVLDKISHHIFHSYFWSQENYIFRYLFFTYRLKFIQFWIIFCLQCSSRIYFLLHFVWEWRRDKRVETSHSRRLAWRGCVENGPLEQMYRSSWK
jgi:hypothetical protein